MSRALLLFAVALVAGTALAGCLGSGGEASARLNRVTGHGVGVGSQVFGYANFTQEGNEVHVQVVVWGLDTFNDFQAGPKGTHIHANGDCGRTFTDGQNVPAGAAGGHFNPDNRSHGEHAGDLGNMEVDESGTGTLEVTVTNINLGSNDTHDVIGRAVVIHAGEDDLQTDPAGDAGSRILCGVIEET